MGKPRVFVLGAGASSPYGLYTGPELKRKIIEILQLGNDHPTKKKLIELNFSPLNFDQFFKAFAFSDQSSIDAFLENQSTFRKLGKALIACALVPREDTDFLFPTSPDWLTLVANSMRSKFEDFDKNQIAFITFNYDRSIEHYLCTTLKNSFGKSEAECETMVRKIPIVHLYGQLGNLWPGEKNHRPYSPGLNAEIIGQCIQSIQIIHEGVEENKAFQDAYEILSNAKEIIFLGLSYDKINMDRLHKIDWWSKTRPTVYGTAFQFTRAEINKLKQRFRCQVSLGDPHEKAYDFLRGRALLMDD